MSPRLFNIINFDGYRADHAEWKRFGRVLLLVAVLPVLVTALVALWVAWRTGEMLSPDEVAQRQLALHERWTPFRDKNGARFKLIRLGQEQPEVLVMGASRMAQFRHEMFAPYSFYNLSRVTWVIDTYPGLMRRALARSQPRVLFLGVDFFTFNPLYTRDYDLRNVRANYRPFGWRDELLAWRDSFVTLFTWPRVLLADGRDPTNGEPIIGLEGNTLGGGFRADGSEAQPDDILTKYRNPDRNLLHGNILNKQPLIFGDKMGAREMADFESTVRLAQARGIQVVCVQMPIYGPLVRYMEAEPRMGILRDFQAHVASGYFQKLGVTMFNFLEFPPYSEDPHYWIDPLHPTDVVSAAVLYEMLADPRMKALLPKIDQQALGDKLVNEYHGDQHVYLYSAGN